MAQINPRQFNQAPIPTDMPERKEATFVPLTPEVTGFYNNLVGNNTSLSVLPYTETAEAVEMAKKAQSEETEKRRRSHMLFIGLGESPKVDPLHPILRGAYEIEIKHAQAHEFKPVADNIARAFRTKHLSYESVAIDLRKATRNNRYTKIALDGIARTRAALIILGIGFDSQAEETEAPVSVDTLKERDARLASIYEAVHKKNLPVVVANFLAPELSDLEAAERYKRMVAILGDKNMVAALGEHIVDNDELIDKMQIELIASGKLDNLLDDDYSFDAEEEADVSEALSEEEF